VRSFWAVKTTPRPHTYLCTLAGRLGLGSTLALDLHFLWETRSCPRKPNARHVCGHSWRQGEKGGAAKNTAGVHHLCPLAGRLRLRRMLSLGLLLQMSKTCTDTMRARVPTRLHTRHTNATGDERTLHVGATGANQAQAHQGSPSHTHTSTRLRATSASAERRACSCVPSKQPATCTARADSETCTSQITS
jgi:hypothetical protein